MNDDPVIVWFMRSMIILWIVCVLLLAGVVAYGIWREYIQPLSERTGEAKGRPDARDGLREDGIRIPCNESLAQRAAKTQAPRAA